MEKFKKYCLSHERGKAELIVLLVYAAGLIIVSCFHEPWFDEAQAWLIAKSASYKDMLTLVPHYEGHPPFWYLILSPFAKLGAPYELSLKAVNITICVGAIAVLLFKSPFPKIVNCVLPFTFFFFYQFGIVSRPYCISMLAIFLAAVCYRGRNERPGRYILSLMLLCLSSAYGIIIAGGLCIVWTFEILAQMKKEHSLSRFYSDKRFWWLCAILLLAIILFIEIIPAEDVYYDGIKNESTILDKLKEWRTYAFFLYVPFDSWMGMAISYNDYTQEAYILIIAAIFGTITWAVLSAIVIKNKKFFTFFVPIFLTIAFMNFKYGSMHHLGFVVLMEIFSFWIMADTPEGIKIPEFFGKITGKIQSKVMKRIAVGGGILLCAMPVVYSVRCSIVDVMTLYSIAPVADFIKENHIEDKKLMASWLYFYKDDEKDDKADDDEFMMNYLFMEMAIPSDHPEIEEHCTYLCSAATFMPYFDKNIFMNYNIDSPDKLYMQYRYKEDPDAIIEKWTEQGLPDFIFDYCPIDDIYPPEMIEGVRYVVVHEVISARCFELYDIDSTMKIYMREDLLDEYPQFEPLYNPDIAG